MNFKKLDLNFDIAKVQAKLCSTPLLFNFYKQRTNEQGPHREVEDIWLRANDITKFETLEEFANFSDAHDSMWYGAINVLPSLRPVIFDLMRFVEGERLGGVLITKLPPGGKVYAHTDDSWHSRYYDKYLVPINSKDGAIFGFNEGDIKAKEGEVWWFNNNVEHWVNNDSEEDRIVMIVCIKTSNKLGERTCLSHK